MKLRYCIKLFFVSIILLSLYFIYHQVQSSQLQLADTQLSKHESLLIIIISAVSYAVISLILSFNWYKLLEYISEQKNNFMLCNYIYSVSCLAKYVPGSILQYANRQMLGKVYNIPQINLIMASYMETVGVLLTSSFLSLFCFLAIQIKDKNEILFGTIFLILLLFGLLPFFYKFIKNHHYLKTVKWPEFHLRKFFPLIIYYCGFFILSGMLLLVIIITKYGTLTIFHIGLILSIWCLAWLVGYIVILAPAGLGVREAILISLLTPLLTEHIAIMVAVLFRISLIIGDVLFAILGWLGLRFTKFRFNNRR